MRTITLDAIKAMNTSTFSNDDELSNDDIRAILDGEEVIA